MPRIPLPPAEPMTLESLAEVARGGMGSVELARVLDGRMAGQTVALKRLHSNIAEDPEFVSMFMDEVWMTSALKHPNVAQVIAWGNDKHGMFLAIELVQGVSLSRLIKEAEQNQEAFAERTVAFLCSQLCAGLTAAHTLVAPDGSPMGLVHRDLTPANVLISFDGVVKIIDFGIAKAEERITHTRTGQLKGKPSYMAPEQQRGGAVDARADLFSFGVVMYEMLAGRRPWTAKGAFDVMMEIANDPHPDLGELRRGLNPEFVAIAHRCLTKKAEDRWGSAAEIKARLDAWLAAKGFTADDQHSFAQFVLRNSQPQVKWWQEALRGEHAKKKAPTFKELEEKIDEEREREQKAARRAAAPPLPRAKAGTVPMPAYPSPPSSDRVSQPSSSGAGAGAGPASKRVASAGTEFMPVSVQRPPDAIPASQRFGPASRVGAVAPTAPMSTPHPLAATAPMSPEPARPVSIVGLPPAAPVVVAAAAVPVPANVAAPQAMTPAPAPSSAPVPASAPAPVPVRRSRVGLVLVLVLIVLGGAATGAWLMRDTLFGADGGSGSTRSTKGR
jgi:serine/threonine protein kinase